MLSGPSVVLAGGSGDGVKTGGGVVMSDRRTSSERLGKSGLVGQL